MLYRMEINSIPQCLRMVTGGAICHSLLVNLFIDGVADEIREVGAVTDVFADADVVAVTVSAR